MREVRPAGETSSVVNTVEKCETSSAVDTASDTHYEARYSTWTRRTQLSLVRGEGSSHIQQRETYSSLDCWEVCVCVCVCV